MSGEGKKFSEGEKNFEKSLKKPLTTTPKSDIINTKRGRTPHKPERVTTMKKLSLETIYSYLSDNGFAYSEIMDELRKEITKGDAQKAKNAEAYDALKELVMDGLSKATNAVTLSELWETIEEEASAQGFTKGKVQYGVTKLWTDEIVKIEGKPNTYRKA